MFTGLVIFSTLGSILLATSGLDPGMIAPVVSALMILSGAVCVAWELGAWRAVASVLFIGIFAEVLGLYTGIPFGNYSYTDQWWPTIPLVGDHRFPLMLPFAWLLLAGGSFLIVRRRLNGWLAVLSAALLATLIDFPLELAMTDVFRYWTWEQPGLPFNAPWTNAVGWLLTSALAAFTMVRTSTESRPAYSPRVVAMFCAFVAIVGSLHRFHWAWILLICISIAILIFDKDSTTRNALESVS